MKTDKNDTLSLESGEICSSVETIYDNKIESKHIKNLNKKYEKARKGYEKTRKRKYSVKNSGAKTSNTTNSSEKRKDEDDNDYHTCEKNKYKICPKCVQLKFTGSDKVGPIYNSNLQQPRGCWKCGMTGHKKKDCINSLIGEFNLEISTDIYDLLIEKKVELLLFYTKLAHQDFRIMKKYVKLGRRIDNTVRIEVKFTYKPRPQNMDG